MLKVDGLSVAIGSVGILRDVSLGIASGEFAGLIGRNGAGKTTLMRTIMGLCRSATARRLRRRRASAASPRTAGCRSASGTCPRTAAHPGLSVEENVLLPAWSAALPGAAARLERVYEAIPEVRAFRDRKALQLSGGQQKLVALARALIPGTKLLLLDEPFEGVAPVLARRLAEVIAGLRREGLSVILSESSLTHAKGLLDRVFVIDRGAVAGG
jgi:branched-chain amino acid transport system ATP-binding protein